MSFDKGLDLEEKITYVEDAEFYGAKAMAIVGISLVAGGSLQVKLEQAVLKGRKAELELRRGTSHRVIDSMKADATRGLKGASKGLEESGNINTRKMGIRCQNGWKKATKSPLFNYGMRLGAFYFG
jgi:hypothetical protein